MSQQMITEGLNILGRYLTEENSPMQAEHDELWLSGPEPTLLKPEDAARLSELGFYWDQSMDSWHRFT